MTEINVMAIFKAVCESVCVCVSVYVCDVVYVCKERTERERGRF